MQKEVDSLRRIRSIIVRHFEAESLEKLLWVQVPIRLVRLPQRNIRYLINCPEQCIGIPALGEPVIENIQVGPNAFLIDIAGLQTTKGPVIKGVP